MTNPTVAGVDLGDSKSLTTVLSPSGDLMDRFTFQMNQDGYQVLADRLPENAKIACEATGMVYPFFRAMTQHGYDVTVANTKELSWISKSKKKNDKADSLKLAKLHMAGILPVAHLMTREEQLTRDLLIQRVRLGQDVTKLKLRILSYLKREGTNELLPKTSDNFSVKRRTAIRSMKFGDERDIVVNSMMDRLEFLEEQFTPFEAAIRGRAKENEDVKIIMSVQGIDFYCASLLCSFIGDVNRFPTDGHLASAFGIVPTERDSSDVKRRGKMSKDGPAIARWVLSVATDTVMGNNDQIKAYYLQVKTRTGRSKKARVATMRKLIRMFYFMLKNRQNWKWQDPEKTRAKISRLGGAS